ncbi:MAG: response regulator [Butyrivibrio sp.]|nr:response regulator [Butyrivibrio sp.]
MKRELAGIIRKKHSVVFIMLICIFVSIAYHVYIDNYEISGSTVAYLVLGFKDMPLIITAGLCGFVPAMICELVIFVFKVINNPELTYTTFIYLVLAMMSYFFSYYGFYRKKKNLLFMTIVFAVVAGPVWGLLLEICAGVSIVDISIIRLGFYFINSLPEMIISVLVIYCSYRYIPKRVQKVLPMLAHYLYEAEHKPIVVFDNWKKSTSIRITIMITGLCALLGIFGAFSAATLMPTLVSRQIALKTMNESGEVDNILGLDSTIDREEIVLGMNTGALEQYTAEIERSYAKIGSAFFGMDYTAFILRMLMLVLSGLVPITSLVNYYAQKRIAEPIKKMSEVMNNVIEAEGTDLVADRAISVNELDIKTGDDIEELYHALTKVVGVGLSYIESIQDKKKLEDDLEIARMANQAKTSFLSNMSHEIRTPINSILGLDEMILRESKDETTIKYARDIKSSGKALLSLINDVLDFSKIEAGKMNIIPVEYETASLLNDLVNIIRNRVKRKKLDFFVNVNPHLPQILYGDEVRIRQCITNLLTNAVKYTEKGTITLDVDFTADKPDHISLEISVTDTGIGIKKEDIDKLSQPFERVDEVRNRTTEGTGLGMSIVRELLELMDSKIEITSTYGSGSTFGFKIGQDVVKWDIIGDYSDRISEVMPQSEEYHASFQAPGAHILIVDDTRANLIVAKGLLKQTRVNVDVAESGKELLEKATQNKYDIIFIDHRMPEMDGVEALGHMKMLEDNKNEYTPCVALTANALSGAREYYIKEGFNDYLSKPIDSARLEEMVVRYIPEELVKRPGSYGYIYNTEEKEVVDLKHLAGRGSSVAKAFFEGAGIDLDTAISSCGDEDILLQVLQQFVSEIDDNTEKIKKYLAEENYVEYTVIVHALKNSARMIGSPEVSKMAEKLEKAGNAKDIDYINENNDEFLKRYTAYKEYLSAFRLKENEAGKPELPDDEFISAIKSIKECAEAFDFKTADEIIKMLDTYNISEQNSSKYTSIRKMVKNADRQGVMQLVTE